MPQSPRTLTRQTHYELVWSKPMLQLALDFGISDAGPRHRQQTLFRAALSYAKGEA
jgi:hypothetical protein